MSEPRSHTVPPAMGEFVPDARWDRDEWREVFPLLIDRYVWDANGHRPLTQAKLQYSAEYLYVIFRVQDRYVRSVHTRYGDPVCQDACVEMFFNPAPEAGPFYFNIESNCGGILFCGYQSGRDENAAQLREEDAKRLDVAATLPAIVDPEVEGPLTWVVEYRVPFAMLERYGPVERPAPGVTWRANFYKCAEINSHPHYGSWSPIDLPRPDFHCPQFFGTLTFG
jgi:hypothetical protein